MSRMNARQAIEERIYAFICDYAEWEGECIARDALRDSPPMPCELIDASDPSGLLNAFQSRPADDSDLTRTKLEELARRHCVAPDLLTRGGFGYGTPRHHDPEIERISDVRINGDKAEVLTEVNGGRCTGFEYQLVKSGQEWRIANILEFHSSDDEAGVHAWSETTTAPVFSLSDDAGLDLAAPFLPGATAVTVETQKRQRLTVTQLGNLVLNEGWLAIVDPGACYDESVPLELKLPSRPCQIDLVRAGYYNLFVRIVFGDLSTVAAYVPARWLGDVPETPPAKVSTRGGSILLTDAGTWALLGKRTIEKFYLQLVQGQPRTTVEKAGLISLPGTQQDALLVGRGGGDFDVHPYWAIDRTGTAQALIVDLAECGEFVEQVIEIPTNENLFGSDKPHPLLGEFGLHVRFIRDDDRITILSKDNSGVEVDLVDKRGEVVTSTNRSGSQSCGDEHSRFLENVPDNLDRMKYKFRWRVWQHAFARDLGI